VVAGSETVRLLFERYENEGVEAMLELLEPNGEFVVSPEASMEPDVYRGYEGARRYFAGFDGALDDVRIQVEDAQDVAPGLVLTRLRLTGVGAVTRIPVEQKAILTFQVRDGLIVRIVTHGDLDSARAEILRGS
jgi:ketosteroid isomerase-like protein